MRVNPFVLVLLFGCKDKEAPKPPPPAPTPAEPTPVADADTDLPPIRAVDETGPGAVTIAIDGASTKLTWGIAAYEPSGLTITLLAHKASCADRDAIDARAGGLRFQLQPGPEGKHYAGHTIGTEVVITRIDKQVTIAPDQLALKLEEFPPLVAGAHVKGSLDGEAFDTVGAGTVKGTFDVEICTEPPSRIRALRAKAPTGPITGKLDKRVLAPKTAHAILGMHYASKAEAEAKQGTRPYIEKLVFYEQADVPCEAHKDKLKSLIYVTAFGTPKAMQTPGDAAIPNGARFDAWIVFDSIGLDAGDHVKGKLWAQTPFEWSEVGELGGTFDATVCAP